MLVGLSACFKPVKYRPGGPYYFEGFYGITQEKEITPDKAKLLVAYWVAFYDSDGKFSSFTKYLHGQFESSCKYYYGPNGSPLRTETVKYDGEHIIHYCNKSDQVLRNDTTIVNGLMHIKYVNKKGEVFQEHIIKAGNK